MVSQIFQSESISIARERGFIPEETVVAEGPGNAGMRTYYRPFWRPVMAGTLFAFSVFVMSWYLMLGFHVGINSAGLIVLGGGAAVWLWVTAFVAYFCGGVIANAMSPSSIRSSWLKGAVVWGFSIPLAMALYAFIAQSAGLMIGLDLPHPVIVNVLQTPTSAAADVGFSWVMFIGLAIALVASLMGSSAASCGCTQRTPGGTQS